MEISLMSTILVGAATAIVFIVATILLKQNGKNRSPLPPSPTALPIIGHFHLLIDKVKPVHQILSSLSKIYGPIMHLKFGSAPVLVVSNSALAKECLTVNDRNFASRPQLVQGKYLGYEYHNMGWAPYGAYWRNARKICVLEHFGEESGLSEDVVTHLIEESFILHGVVDIGDYIPWLKRFDLQGSVKAMKKVTEKLDLYMQRIVEQHREKRIEVGSETEDFIDVLISQSEENGEAIHDKDAFIKATAVIMFSAGSDTSSIAIEWALSLLLQHPHVMRKAQEEIDSKVGRDRVVEESDIPKLTYLQAIVKETLRLHPSAPLMMPHKSMEACTVGGFHIPAGTMLMVNTWAIHRDPKLWNKPLDFIPERFMEKGIEMDNVQVRGIEYEMLPFGGGRRGCPGTVLAMSMVQTALASLLQSYDWFVPDGTILDMREKVGMTTPRTVPLELLAKPRLPRHLYQKKI